MKPDIPPQTPAETKTETLEGKMQEAVDKLSDVNKALKSEAASRHVLEAQLATATRAEEVARHAAFHDALTGLPNRALFDDRLEHGLAQARRHGRALAVMYIDLDDFKTINDVHGHDVGDAVLQAMADRLKKHARNADTVSRYGGDEFLYLLVEAGDDRRIAAIAEKLVNALRKPVPVSIGELTINASIGISIFPKDGTVAGDLVKSADKAMYEAKQSKSGYAFAP